MIFVNKDERINLTELIHNNVSEFDFGVTDQLLFMLFNGHIQKCYTEIKSFDYIIDQVCYRRYNDIRN